MTINSPRFIKDVEIERRHVRNRDAQLKDDRGAIKVGKGRGGLSVLHAFHIIKAAQINTLRANRAAISTQGYAVVQRHFGLLIASRGTPLHACHKEIILFVAYPVKYRISYIPD